MTAGHGSRQAQQLFQYCGTAADIERGDLGVLVCDDTHQLRATSNTQLPPATPQQQLDAVADELNDRPRQTLGWRKPTEAFNKLLLDSPKVH
ncbi:hypothetical protein [Amycolatopsis aidingensis]